jgi:hypothetical protein
MARCGKCNIDNQFSYLNTHQLRDLKVSALKSILKYDHRLVFSLWPFAADLNETKHALGFAA